jgi:hypothetical protein
MHEFMWCIQMRAAMYMFNKLARGATAQPAQRLHKTVQLPLTELVSERSSETFSVAYQWAKPALHSALRIGKSYNLERRPKTCADLSDVNSTNL